MKYVGSRLTFRASPCMYEACIQPPVWRGKGQDMVRGKQVGEGKRGEGERKGGGREKRENTD